MFCTHEFQDSCYNEAMETARVIVPIVVAVLVLHLFGALPGSREEDERRAQEEQEKGKTLELRESFFPLAKDCHWKYDVRGVFTSGESEKEAVFTRSVLRKSQGNKFQLMDSRNGRVEETYYVEPCKEGIVMTSMSLDKRRVVFLPKDFGPGVKWQLTKVLRAKASKRYEEMDLGPWGIRDCLKVHYERFYDEGQTAKPGWYYDGTRWFSRGIGQVKVSLRDVQRPRLNGRIDIKETWEIRTLTAAKLPHMLKEPKEP